MGAQGGAAGVKKGRAGNLGVRARGESRGNLGRALRLCGEDGAGSWARTVSGFGAAGDAGRRARAGRRGVCGADRWGRRRGARAVAGRAGVSGPWDAGALAA